MTRFGAMSSFWVIPIWPSGAPTSAFVEAGSYADRTLPTTANDTREWSWGLGDVVNAIIGAGLTLESLNEHTVGFYPAIADCVAGADGHYRLPDALDGRYPLTFQSERSETLIPGHRRTSLRIEH